jgi:tripartite-type tricarboxylate transporter receptor subunit TctC
MKNLLLAAVFVAAFGIIESATAQTFPTRNITILVPYAPGAAADATARTVGEHMAATLGRNVLIENVTGGSGLIATARVARVQQRWIKTPVTGRRSSAPAIVGYADLRRRRRARASSLSDLASSKFINL